MPKPPMGRFYPLTDSGNVHGWSHLEQTRCLLAAGIGFLQVREKRMSDGELFRQLQGIGRECRCRGAAFLVNDRADLALAAGADGVHLGQDDLPVEAAREILGPEAVIGLSTHSLEQFQRALDLPVDYLAVGPLFETRTKKSPYAPLGLDFLRAVRRLTRLPLVAIGGIDVRRAEEAWAAGADSVAVVSDWLSAADPSQRVRQYLRRAERIEAAAGASRRGPKT